MTTSHVSFKETAPELASQRGYRRREFGARMLIWVFGLAGVLSAILLVLRGVLPIEATWPLLASGALNIPLSPSPVSVVLLFLLAWGLKRRLRLALVTIAVFEVIGGLMSVSILFRLWDMGGHGHSVRMVAFRSALEILAILVAIAAVILTVWVRSAFPARIPGLACVRAGLVLASGLLITVLWAASMAALTSANVAAGLWSTAGAFLRSFGVGRPRFYDAGPLAHWIPGSVAILMSITLIAAAYVLLRPVRTSHRWSGDQEVRLRELIADWPVTDSLTYFATRRDREALFAPSGKAAVTYRQQGAHCLVGGDPIGDPKHWPAAIAALMQHCREVGQIPVACSTSEAGARAFSDFGMTVVPLGDEAIIDVDRFDLKLASMTAVRQAVNRAHRGGIDISIRRQSNVPADELTRLGELAQAWLGGASDRGFTMALNRWGDAADRNTVIVTAHVKSEPVALLSFVPGGPGRISLDVMRHGPQAPNGTTEALVAQTVKWCADNGVNSVSLNFVVGRRIFAASQEIGASPVTRFNSRVLVFFDRFFQLESLYRSNQKYDPIWAPRFLCIPDSTSLLPAGIAFSMAEGFLPEVFGRIRNDETLTAEQLTRVEELSDRSPHAPDLAPARRSPVFQHRLAHAQALGETGYAPYPIGAFEAQQLASLESLAAWPLDVSVSARVRRIRRHGGVMFLDLVDGAASVQAVVERSTLGESFRVWERNLDTGDIVVVMGRPGESRTGTPSVLVNHLAVVSKALVPIPFDGITDPEFRARHRSLDLLTTPHEMTVLRQRSAVMAATRRFLNERGLTEVETPVLNTVHGGASARPFKTFINAYSTDLTLRIAPELYLKRLLVAGSGPIYEFSRNFRNEGADATHNPEFTALEAYIPFADYRVMKELTEALIKNAAFTVSGTESLMLGSVRGKDFTLTDVSHSWPMVPIEDALSEHVGRPVSMETDFDELLAIAEEHDVPILPTMGPGAVIEELYGELVEANTVSPTFYCDFPQETSPLTGPHRSKPGRVERWDLVINGMEMGTAYSELADPIEQRRRLTEQSWKAAHGDPEAMQVDEDFLSALEAGMPPAGGLGIGVDRLIMLLTQTTIRDVLTFPFVRPRK